MSNAELKDCAWKRLWTDKWVGRLFVGGLLLGLCGYVVLSVIKVVLQQLDVLSWQDYFKALALNRQDQTTPVPNLTTEFIYQATSSSILSLFFSWLMAGIATYGGAVILRRCLANDERGWLGAAFGGYRMPFEMLWMFVRLALAYAVWGLPGGVLLGLSAGVCAQQLKALAASGSVVSLATLAVLISLALMVMILLLSIPFYRYRFLWLVKAEHPDWRVGRCFSFCRRLMKGNLMKSVRLDCAYWKSLTMLLLLGVAAAVCLVLAALLRTQGGAMTALAALAGLVVLMVLFVASLIVSLHIRVGQGFLYQELKAALGEAE